ncbi:hypothetical protein J7E88_27505 [Streptomyces sp. ISL-10]|nr:hypothetical protein [Streptomyces sp. ISL-10]
MTVCQQVVSEQWTTRSHQRLQNMAVVAADVEEARAAGPPVVLDETRAAVVEASGIAAISSQTGRRGLSHQGAGEAGALQPAVADLMGAAAESLAPVPVAPPVPGWRRPPRRGSARRRAPWRPPSVWTGPSCS